MTEREEQLMMSSIRDYKRDSRNSIQERVERNYAFFRTAANTLRTSLDELDGELEARAQNTLDGSSLRAMESVLNNVAFAWEIDPGLIRRRSASPKFLIPRQVAMLIMSEDGHTSAGIGRYFGMHHTTVMHSIKVAATKISLSKDIAAKAKEAGRQTVN